MKKIIFLLLAVFSLSACVKVVDRNNKPKATEKQGWRKSEVETAYLIRGNENRMDRKYVLLKDGTSFSVVFDYSLNTLPECGSKLSDIVFAEEGDIVEYAEKAEGKYVFRPLIKKEKIIIKTSADNN